MRFIYVLLFTLIISTATAAEVTCHASNNSCDAYLCLEQKHQCGYTGYPLKFGYRFCQNFLDLKPNSEKLQKWLDDVRYCLQDKLIQNESYHCNNLFDASIDAHVSCYEETGYCELNRSEQNYVKKQIIKEFMMAPIYVLKNAKKFLKEACL